MYSKGFKGKHFSKKDLTHYKKFKSYKDLMSVEFPNSNKLKEKEWKQKEKNYKKLKKSFSGRESEKFRTLQSELIIYYLKKIPEFKLLQKLLEQPNKNLSKIIKLIKIVRSKIMDNELFKNSSHIIVDTEKEYNRMLKKISQETDKKTDKISKPKYESEKFKVKKLYHWIPDYLYDIVKEQGLLPGFLTGANLKFFIYSSFEKNTFWPESLQYSRNGKIPNKFIELEISYTPTTPVYLWLAYYLNNRYQTHYPATLLSSEIVPLDKQVSEMINYDDQEPLDLKEPHYFSQFQQKIINYYNKASVSKWEYSEILTNYVPPSAIKKVGEKSLKKKK